MVTPAVPTRRSLRNLQKRMNRENVALHHSATSGETTEDYQRCTELAATISNEPPLSCFRPISGGSAQQSDCGILPSE
jgi:hypothetical protein